MQAYGMDYELYNKIKKCNLRVLRDLQESELPWAYFVCYRMTGDAPHSGRALAKGVAGNDIYDIVSWRMSP